MDEQRTFYVSAPVDESGMILAVAIKGRTQFAGKLQTLSGGEHRNTIVKELSTLDNKGNEDYVLCQLVAALMTATMRICFSASFKYSAEQRQELYKLFVTEELLQVVGRVSCKPERAIEPDFFRLEDQEILPAIDHRPIAVALDCIEAAVCLTSCMLGQNKGDLTANETAKVLRDLNNALDAISPEFSKALAYPADAANVNELAPVECASSVASHRVDHARQRMSHLPQFIADDLTQAFRNDPAATRYAEIGHCYPGPRAITVYRLAHELQLLHIPIVPRMLSELAKSRYLIEIHPGATIDRSFFIDHGSGVVIGSTTYIGRYVVFYQGVACGAWHFEYDESGVAVRGKKRHPTILDNVKIYSDAKIYGGTTLIGNGCVIGAGMVVTKSMQDNTTIYRGRDGEIKIRDLRNS